MNSLTVDTPKAAEAKKECIVYFVDDDRGMVHSTLQWLKLSGLKVQAFADSKLLLKTVRANEACVVVSDIRMPDLDGMSLMKHIHTRDKDIPVILITGHGDIPLAVEAMKSGAHEFITKPFSPERLVETIEDAQAKRISALEERKYSAGPNSNIAVEVTANEASPVEAETSGPLNDRIDEYEKTLIQATLKKYGGEISSVLSELGLPRRTLNAKMKKYGISRRDFR